MMQPLTNHCVISGLCRRISNRSLPKTVVSVKKYRYNRAEIHSLTDGARLPPG